MGEGGGALRKAFFFRSLIRKAQLTETNNNHFDPIFASLSLVRCIEAASVAVVMFALILFLYSSSMYAHEKANNICRGFILFLANESLPSISILIDVTHSSECMQCARHFITCCKCVHRERFVAQWHQRRAIFLERNNLIHFGRPNTEPA